MSPKNNVRSRRPGKGRSRDEHIPVAIRNYINKTLLMKPLAAERKWYQIGCANIAVGAGQVLAVNPFYLLGQGTAQDNRIGLNVSNAHLLVDIQYSHFGCSSIATGKTSASNFRVVTFTNPAKWHQTTYNVPEAPTAGSGTVINNSDVFLDSGTDRMTHSYLNRDINSIIDDSGQKMVQSSSAPSGAAWSSVGFQGAYRKMIRIGDLRWEANALSYLRDTQLYIWVVADYQGYGAIAPATNDNLGSIGFNFMVTYQDS